MFQRQVSFGEAISLALSTNYCNFSGRSSRSEYWYFVLFNMLISFVINILTFATMSDAMLILGGIISLVLLLPGLGLAVRRLHDVGKSGWWLLIGLIPLIGAILLLVWFCTDSEPYTNRYGEVPNLEEV